MVTSNDVKQLSGLEEESSDSSDDDDDDADDDDDNEEEGEEVCPPNCEVQLYDKVHSASCFCCCCFLALCIGWHATCLLYV